MRELYGYARFPLRKTEWPEVKFVIFAQGRSGSTLLRTLLDSHPMIQCDSEILFFKMAFPGAFISSQAALSKRPMYGFKVKIYQLTQDQDIRDPKQFMLDLSTQGWQIIYLKRRNILRQAISSIVAEQRQAYQHRRSEGRLELGRVMVDGVDLLGRMEERKGYLAQEEQVLEGLPYFPLVYERALLTTDNWQTVLDQIFAYLELPSAPVTTPLVKITPHRLADLIENYGEVAQVLHEAGYGA
ncbi:MAG: hypothetical protein ACRDIB_03465, partial [Ardenticatenaceae bacterium]